MSINKNIHTISILVANKPGVLVRCAQVFARRGFNIDSLVVSPSINPKYSRMTVTAQGDLETLEQIIKQSSKLVDVIHCGEHKGEDAIHRELALVKLKINSKAKAVLLKLIKSRAHIVEESKNAIIIGQYGTTDQLDALEVQLKKIGIIEYVRSGKLVMAKGSEAT